LLLLLLSPRCIFRFLLFFPFCSFCWIFDPLNC
jgi:hypothetical protein